MGKRRRDSKSNLSEGRRNKPKKSWKSHQRIFHIEVNSNGDIDDSELLSIQGLVRCKYCENTYPKDLSDCPNKSCNANP